MGRFVSATGQFLLATYRQFSRPPTGSFSCPLTVAARFDALRTAYNGKQPPSDMRCEQDIWIPWIAQQSGEAIRNVFVVSGHVIPQV
jgi:hypothetical protein